MEMVTVAHLTLLFSYQFLRKLLLNYEFELNRIKYSCLFTGFHLRFSPEYSDAGVSLSTDLKSVKTTLYKQLTAVSDSVLSSCVHFWRAHVVKLPAKANLSSVEIGIQRDDRENREGGQWQGLYPDF